jgi:hypothetical protein
VTKLEDLKTRQDVLDYLQEVSSTLTVGAVYSIYGFIMSARHGTPQMIAAYAKLGALFGAVAVTARVLRDDLQVRWTI